MESSFLQDMMDQLFDVYCVDEQQRRQMEIRHCLRMAREDFTFYEDQRTECKRRCVDEVVPLTQPDLRFRHDDQQPSIPMSTYASASPSLEQCSAFASDSNNDRDGSASQSSETSEKSIFTPQDSHLSHAQNRRRWTNLARMCERYQLSDRAGAAIATSTLQDMGIVTNEDKSLVIDPSKLRRERERCRKEICQEEVSNFKYVSGLYFDGR